MASAAGFGALAVLCAITTSGGLAATPLAWTVPLVGTLPRRKDDGPFTVGAAIGVAPTNRMARTEDRTLASGLHGRLRIELSVVAFVTALKHAALVAPR